MNNTNNLLAIGYVYDKNGTYDKKYYFKDDEHTIATFLYQNKGHACTVTDWMDRLIISTDQEFNILNLDIDGQSLCHIVNHLDQLRSGKEELHPLLFDRFGKAMPIENHFDMLLA